jgi:hypothetical protein
MKTKYFIPKLLAVGNLLDGWVLNNKYYKKGKGSPVKRRIFLLESDEMEGGQLCNNNNEERFFAACRS